MVQQARRIVIVGGGSAGWMTAAYLSKALERDATITLVESSNITTIGVGEATFSTIKVFFDYLGLNEADWMPSCNATYKMAIRFAGWNKEGRHFYHPFQRYEVVNGFHIAEWWLKLKRNDEPFDYACFTVPLLCDSQRAPRFLDGTPYDEGARHLFTAEYMAKGKTLSDLRDQYPYGYHFDASLLARFMRDYATERGVTQVVDDVVDVALAEDGSIKHIVTRERGPIAADLFIDCTGFRGVLINKALGEPFISFSDALLCDSAIAMQIPVDIKKHGINPYTTATALSSGWVWDIPLYGRVGTGYVYSRAFQSRAQAEQEFREHLGPRAGDRPASHIDMRIGRNRRSWVKNCVAIGLSSGFVEPLESTGIFFIQHGIEELVAHFPGAMIEEEHVRSYNTVIANCIDGIRDFLTLHYFASSRVDTSFWKATKHEIKLNEMLHERFSLWRKRLPNARNIHMKYHGFESYSYSAMLLGLGCRPERHLPILDHMDDEKAGAVFGAIRDKAARLSAALPSQYDYLTHVIKSVERSSYLDEVVGKYA
jgi:tryptophan halogenase